MGFYEIPVDIRAIFWYLFCTEKVPKNTRISPVFLKNTWYNCIILQLFDFYSSKDIFSNVYRHMYSVVRP